MNLDRNSYSQAFFLDFSVEHKNFAEKIRVQQNANFENISKKF